MSKCRVITIPLLLQTIFFKKTYYLIDLSLIIKYHTLQIHLVHGKYAAQVTSLSTLIGFQEFSHVICITALH